MAVPPRLVLENVTKTYSSPAQRTRVLRSVSLRLEPGEIVWVNGPSGSGKSSLINIAGLLATPSSGEVRFNGSDVTHSSSRVASDLRAQHIGMIFQSHNLLPELTALENVLLAMRRSKQLEEARALLERVGLGRQLNVRAKKLSGGQQQRVAVARALINAPELLLADEPISGLDLENADTILREIAAASAAGCSVIISSHDPAVGAIAHRGIKLEHGAVVALPGYRHDWLRGMSQAGAECHDAEESKLIDSTLVLRDLRSSLSRYRVVLLFMAVAAAGLLLLSAVVGQGASVLSRHLSKNSAVSTIWVQSASTSGAATQLTQANIERIAAMTHVKAIEPWAQQGLMPESASLWTDSGTPLVLWATPRIAYAQPAVNDPKSTVSGTLAYNEVLMPDAVGRKKYRFSVGKTYDFTYTMATGASSGVEQKISLKVVGTFDNSVPGSDGNAPVYVSGALEQKLIAARAGLRTGSPGADYLPSCIRKCR